MLRSYNVQTILYWCLISSDECYSLNKCPKGFIECLYCKFLCGVYEKCPMKNIYECEYWK
jgi:hypothetical protein